MAHSVVFYQAWVRWLLCNDIIPKAIPLSQLLLHNAPSEQNIPTPKDLLSLQELAGFNTHVTAPHTQRDGCMWLASTVVEDHAMTLTSTPSNHQTPLFSPLSTLTQHTLGCGHNATVFTSLCWKLFVDAMLSCSLPNAQVFVGVGKSSWMEKKNWAK